MLIIGAIFRRGLLLVTFLSRPLLFILTFRRGLLLLRVLRLPLLFILLLVTFLRGLLLLRGIGTFFTFLLLPLFILATFLGLLRLFILPILLLVTFPSIFLVFASLLFALILETLSDDKHSVHRKGAGPSGWAQDTQIWPPWD